MEGVLQVAVPEVVRRRGVGFLRRVNPVKLELAEGSVVHGRVLKDGSPLRLEHKWNICNGGARRR